MGRLNTPGPGSQRPFQYVTGQLSSILDHYRPILGKRFSRPSCYPGFGFVSPSRSLQNRSEPRRSARFLQQSTNLGASSYTAGKLRPDKERSGSGYSRSFSGGLKGYVWVEVVDVRGIYVHLTPHTPKAVYRGGAWYVRLRMPMSVPNQAWRRALRRLREKSSHGYFISRSDTPFSVCVPVDLPLCECLENHDHGHGLTSDPENEKGSESTR